MSQLTRVELWQRLSEEGMVSGDLPGASQASSPWPVRAMLGIAGWLGALFLLGFAGSAFAILFRSAGAALPAGVVCCVAAYALFRGLPNNDFVSQFGFAISLAGQALLMFGLGNLSGTRLSSTPFLLMAMVEAALAVAVPNYIHRVFTTVTAFVCLFVACEVLRVPILVVAAATVGMALIWLNQVRMAERPSLWEPLGYGFALALVHLDGALIVGPEWLGIFERRYASGPLLPLWTGSLVTGLMLFYVVWQLRDRAGVRTDSRWGIFIAGATLALALCGLGAPGITAALLVLILGFANGDRVLMGLGVLAFGTYLSHFYYQLSTTLLMKSMVLVATGVVLLALYWTIDRFLPPEASIDA